MCFCACHVFFLPALSHSNLPTCMYTKCPSREKTDTTKYVLLGIAHTKGQLRPSDGSFPPLIQCQS